MFRTCTITSGNAGGGMTPLTVNLGTSIALLERETCLLNADIGMDASRAFKRIAARMSGGEYKEEAGGPAKENFVDRLARAEFI